MMMTTTTVMKGIFKNEKKKRKLNSPSSSTTGNVVVNKLRFLITCSNKHNYNLNDVLMKVLSFISFRELQTLRLVSKFLAQMVIQNTQGSCIHIIDRFQSNTIIPKTPPKKILGIKFDRGCFWKSFFKTSYTRRTTQYVYLEDVMVLKPLQHEDYDTKSLEFDTLGLLQGANFCDLFKIQKICSVNTLLLRNLIITDDVANKNDKKLRNYVEKKLIFDCCVVKSDILKLLDIYLFKNVKVVVFDSTVYNYDLLLPNKTVILRNVDINRFKKVICDRLVLRNCKGFGNEKLLKQRVRVNSLKIEHNEIGVSFACNLLKCLQYQEPIFPGQSPTNDNDVYYSRVYLHLSVGGFVSKGTISYFYTKMFGKVKV